MSRTTRTRATYANTVSSLALVLAVAGGGTAMAAGLTKDSVGSRHLKDGTVRSVDLRDESVTGRDVDEASLGTVPTATNADVSTLARSADQASQAVHAQTADKLLGAMRASVDAAGQLQEQLSVGAVAAVQTATPGRYLVTFERPVTDCSFMAGVAHSGTDPVVGFASAWVTPVAVNPTFTRVTVETHAPGAADVVPDPLPFTLEAICAS